MKTWKQSVIGILAILAILFTACNRGSSRTEASTQSQTGFDVSEEIIISASEYPISQNNTEQAALEYEELRIGSSVSGTVSRDWKENYNIRALEAGYILLEIESDVEIYLEIYNDQQFITTNMNDSDEISSKLEITAQPNTVYLLTVQSYVRDVTEASFRITASFDR
ncbi:MAG: hypothetical protein FWB73_00650 [Treponema sp.]|nr:hypothetical protein [Treponema sp.]